MLLYIAIVTCNTKKMCMTEQLFIYIFLFIHDKDNMQTNL